MLAAAATPDPNAPSVTFCTIAHNTTDGLGGGIFCMDSILRLTTAFWENRGGEETGSQIALTDDSLNGNTIESGIL
jgi:hypothetical protein